MTPPAADEQIWVEIAWIELAPEDRAPLLPEATARTPLRARVRGTAATAEAGATATVVTRAGRRVEGEVVAVLPGYGHGFGAPVPAWIRMRDAIARARMEAASR